MLKEFRQFIVRGNLVDLAVAVVLGAAFGAVVSALVKDLVTPLIAAVAGEPDFGNIAFTVHGSRFAIGHFLNALVSFALIAGVVFFLVVKPVNALLTRFQGERDTTNPTRDCPECLSAISVAARRCSFCTSPVERPDSGDAPEADGAC